MAEKSWPRKFARSRKYSSPGSNKKSVPSGTPFCRTYQTAYAAAFLAAK